MAGSATLELLLRARDEASAQLARLRGELQETERSSFSLGDMLKSAGAAALGFAAAIAGMQAVGATFGFVKDAVIGMNASLEQSTLQFQTLMGDADKARQHVESLFRFAAETPFETGPIIEASRLLHTFGGAALNTQDTLRLVGDAAAATSNQINEVAFWVGRAYSQIQAGRPFGEAAMRLQEMGILSAEGRARLEELSASGASSAQVWAALQQELGRFSGAMKLQAGTWQGLTSTISDNLKLLTATAFRPLFDLLKEGAAALAGFLQSEQAQQFAQGVAATLQRVIGTVREFIASLAQPGAASGLLALLNPLGALAREVLPALMPLFQALAQALGTIAATVGPPVAQLIGTIGAILRDAIAQVLPSVVMLFQQLAPIFAQILAALAPLIAQGLQVLISTILPPLINLISQFVTWLSQNEMVVKLLAAALVVLIAAMNPVPAAIAAVLAAVALLKQHWEDIANFFTGAVPAAIERLTNALTSIPVVGPIIEGFLNSMKLVFQTVWDNIKTIVETAINVIKGIIKVVTSLIRGDWEGAWEGIKQIAEAIWDGIKGLIENRLALIRSIVANVLGTIRGVWEDVWGAIQGAAGVVGNAIVGIITGAFGRMLDGVRSILGNLLEEMSSLPGRILGALGDLGGLLWDAGRALIQGLIDGITSMMGPLEDAVSWVKGKLPDWKGPLEDDRRLLIPAGRAVMEGLMAGISGELPALRELLGDVTGAIAGLGAAPARPLAVASAPAPVPVAAGPSYTFNITINATSYEGGQAAARGFYDELRRRGVVP